MAARAGVETELQRRISDVAESLLVAGEAVVDPLVVGNGRPDAAVVEDRQRRSRLLSMRAVQDRLEAKPVGGGEGAERGVVARDLTERGCLRPRRRSCRKRTNDIGRISENFARGFPQRPQRTQIFDLFGCELASYYLKR